MKTLIALLFVGGLAAQTPPMIPMATGGGPVGGATNLTTVGSVPYVSASGTLDQDAGQFFWDATNNRLGIGTTAPEYSLSVYKDANGQSTISLDNPNAGVSASALMEFKNGALSGNDRLLTGVTGTGFTAITGWADTAIFWSTANLSGGIAIAASSGSINFETGGSGSASRRMVINSSGNVGIGTATPAYLLDVAKSGASGTFRAYDQTASTGSTLGVFRAGVAQSGNVLEVQNNAGSNVLSVTATGALTSAVSIVAGGNITAGTTQDVGWSTRSTMTSPVGGVITLYNNAQTDFNRLQFGGTTSSFPSIQRSTTKLFFRLADDSAGATVRAGGYESSDGTAGATVTTCTGFKNGLCISGT